MNLFYVLNYAIFSVFLTLFAIEIGIALISLFSYNEYGSVVRKYLMPIWEIDGTFAVFYLVNFEATFPKLLPTVASLYIAPLFLAALFFILRNAFVAYSEYIGQVKEKFYMKIYAISTLIVSVLIFSVLDSSVSGSAVNLSNNSTNLILLIFNPFNILMLISILLLSFFIACSLFQIKMRKFGIISLIAGILLGFIAISAYAPYVFSSIMGMPIILVIFALLLILTLALFTLKNKKTGIIASLLLLISINLFGLAEYPLLFGGQITITDYLTNTASAAGIELITIIGGMALVLSLSYFVYITYLKKISNQ